jgi:acetyl-CoA hydrolase
LDLPLLYTAMSARIELAALNLAEWVRPGDRVVWSQGCGEPLSLTERLMGQRHAIGGFAAFTGLCYSATANPEFADAVTFQSYHGGASNQRLAAAGKLDILPCHYSQLAGILARRTDVLLLQLSPADAAGRHSLGVTHDYLIPLLGHARTIIAEINDQVPWVHGERTVTADDIDVLVRTSRPPLELPSRDHDAVDRAIAAHVAGLIEDGATLQVGVGALPTAILSALAGHRHLGIHSGTLVDAMVDLIEAGAVDNSRKGIDAGLTVGGNLLGTRRLFAFADRNPAIAMRSSDYTHDAAVLARIEKLVALNSAVEVDLTGQINAESADGRYFGGVGGAVDFLRGAARSHGGVPVVALRSRADGKSKIVAHLSGPVSTSRADAGAIVTEHGVADLRGQPLRERIKRMIAIAHPDDRDALERAGRTSH